MYGIIAISGIRTWLTWYCTISFLTTQGLHYHSIWSMTTPCWCSIKFKEVVTTIEAHIWDLFSCKAGDLNCSTINIVTWQHATCYKPFKLPSGHSENENIPQIWPVCAESALLYMNNLTWHVVAASQRKGMTLCSFQTKLRKSLKWATVIYSPKSRLLIQHTSLILGWLKKTSYISLREKEHFERGFEECEVMFI